jgi:hypothetical protein
MPDIAVVAWDDETMSVTVGIDGKRYEYFLGDRYNGARSALHRLRFAPGRQLNWLKKRGTLHVKSGREGTGVRT